VDHTVSSKRTFNKPKWKGEDLKGKIILVWGEQGIGDEIIFSTCINDLINENCQIIIECQKRLVKPFARSFPSNLVRESSFNKNSPFSAEYNDYDFHIPMGSLMSFYRNDINSFKKSSPYIIVESNIASEFENRLVNSNKKLRVGISWRSGLMIAERNMSYTSLLDWGSIFNLKDIDFINLQYGDCESELKEAEEKFNIQILRWPDLDLKMVSTISLESTTIGQLIENGKLRLEGIDHIVVDTQNKLFNNEKLDTLYESLESYILERNILEHNRRIFLDELIEKGVDMTTYDNSDPAYKTIESFNNSIMAWPFSSPILEVSLSSFLN
jgi:hypothetical protein